jgi:hypothetical protein
MSELSDADLGLLLRAYWSGGGGARGSSASQNRLIKAGLAVKKGINLQAYNEQIFGERINVTDLGKAFLRTGKL